MKFFSRIIMFTAVNNMFVTPEYTGIEECSSETMESVWNQTRQTSCQLRHVTINLDASNHTGTVQVIPSQTVVKRCGGSCLSPSHSCYPTSSTMVSVEAMIISTSWNEGEWSTLCQTFRVREDTACACGCTVRPEDCTVHQYYQPQACKCICKNWKLRNSCVSQDKYWDTESCTCLCKNWRSCSTGYLFDGQNSCTCVPTFVVASPSIVVVVAVALFSALGLLTLLILSRKSGNANLSRRETLARVLTEEEI
ncbi:uncharacterized protein LOC111707006 [Eurytemora carolleeae]|uniref:uncharacterized protein LOC111707006 n=1 Tax=Eurytemora carolleeae TaxID=1294199 RepID=UPI000C764318|nr:uncharacterized protein LOC111707006 [Eurytemora carolleeae]|eukprot:XP_023335748.1 uncharacterized protein LOC111707006 [Eurytemora affinis]